MSQSSLLQQAVQAAQTGERERARRLFINIVNEDPHNAEAWMHLSRLVDDPGDQLISIENALVIQPGDDKLLEMREAHLQAHPHLRPPVEDQRYSEALAQAQKLASEGQFDDAIAMYKMMTNRFPGREQPWLELARLEPGIEERAATIKKVLESNPRSQGALELLEQLQKEQKNPILRGQYLEEQGEFDLAAEVYLRIVTHSQRPSQRIEAQHRFDAIRLKKEARHIQPVHPNLNLWRMSVGPVLLFAVLLFIQSGLKVNHLPLAALPGILGVFTGSLLVAFTEMVPAHPWWVAWFGQPGTGDEPEMRRGLRLLGWALMLAPYTIFTIEAGHRLSVLQSSILSGMR
jgi:tetratricopeptide (TPR) repeat protein